MYCRFQSRIVDFGSSITVKNHVLSTSDRVLRSKIEYCRYEIVYHGQKSSIVDLRSCIVVKNREVWESRIDNSRLRQLSISTIMGHMPIYTFLRKLNFQHSENPLTKITDTTPPFHFKKIL